MKQELLKGLTEEQIAKVKACKSQAEILELAKKEGVALTDEQLEAVSGGGDSSHKCPDCGSKNTVVSKGTKGKMINGIYVTYYKCKDCGHVFYVI